MSTLSRPDRRPFEARLLSSLDRLQRFVERRHGGALADDIVQETLLRAWKGRGGFDESKELWPWLKIVAGNAASRRFESESRLRTEDAEVDLIHGTDGGEPQGNEETQAILGRLHGEEREVVDRFYLHGQSVAEIAQERQCPEGTVKSQLSRARKRLAQLLGAAGAIALGAWIFPSAAPAPEPAAVIRSHSMSIEVLRPEAPKFRRRDLSGSTGPRGGASQPVWTVSNGRFVQGPEVSPMGSVPALLKTPFLGTTR